MPDPSEQMDKLFRERYAHRDTGGFQEAHWNKLAAQLPVAGAAVSGGLLAKLGLSSKALVIAGTATTLTVATTVVVLQSDAGKNQHNTETLVTELPSTQQESLALPKEAVTDAEEMVKRATAPEAQGQAGNAAAPTATATRPLFSDQANRAPSATASPEQTAQQTGPERPSDSAPTASGSRAPHPVSLPGSDAPAVPADHTAEGDTPTSNTPPTTPGSGTVSPSPADQAAVPAVETRPDEQHRQQGLASGALGAAATGIGRATNFFMVPMQLQPAVAPEQLEAPPINDTLEAEPAIAQAAQRKRFSWRNMISIAGGMAYHQGFSNTLTEGERQLSPQIGVAYRMPLSSRWSVSGSAWYQQRNGHLLRQFSTVRTSYFFEQLEVTRLTVEKMEFLQVPALVHYRLGNRHALHAGIHASWLLNTTSEWQQRLILPVVEYVEEQPATSRRGFTEAIPSISWGLSLGYEYEFLRFGALGARVNWGLTDLSRDAVLPNSNNDRARELALYLRMNLFHNRYL